MGFRILLSLAAAIAYEWIAGPEVHSLMELGSAAIRTACATMLALVVAETVHALFRAVMTLDDRPFASRQNTTQR